MKRVAPYSSTSCCYAWNQGKWEDAKLRRQRLALTLGPFLLRSLQDSGLSVALLPATLSILARDQRNSLVLVLRTTTRRHGARAAAERSYHWRFDLTFRLPVRLPAPITPIYQTDILCSGSQFSPCWSRYSICTHARNFLQLTFSLVPRSCFIPPCTSTSASQTTCSYGPHPFYIRYAACMPLLYDPQSMPSMQY